jgi:hypothetical protein
VKDTRVDGPGPGAAFAAAALAAAVALPSLANGLVYDDVAAISENPLVHSLGHPLRIWTSSYWPAGQLYRPLTIQLFAAEWWAGKGAPLPFHLANVVLYAAVTALVYRVARRLLPGVAAFAAAALFAVHPVHVEVVANAVGQSELLMTLCVLGATDRYLAWRAQGGLGAGRRALLALLYLLAIASKETGYVLPGLLLAAELLVVEDGRPGRARWREVRPVFALLAAAMVAGLLLRIALLSGLKAETATLPLEGLGPAQRALVMLAAAPEWVRLLVWPAHLQAQYGPPGVPVGVPVGARHLLGLGLLAGATVLLAATWRRAPVIALGLGWIAIALAPVSNLATATGVIVAERNLFLPSVGLVLVAGEIIAALGERFGKRPKARVSLAAVLSALIVAGAVRSAGRASAWRTQDGFFEHLARDAPDSYRAQLGAGSYFLGKHRFAEAERALASARALYQGDERVFEAYGQLYRVQNRCDRALPIFAEGVSRLPEATVVRSRLIECALQVGDTARALRTAEAAVALGQTEFAHTVDRLRGLSRQLPPAPDRPSSR